jgi:hypothetical protein
MSFLLRPIPISPTQLLVNAGADATVGNLARPQPKLVYAPISPAGPWGPYRVDVDLGADTEFDTLALLYHTGQGSGTYRLYGRTAAEGPFVAGGGGETTLITTSPADRVWKQPPTVETSRFHALFVNAAALTFRYVRMWVRSLDALNANWSAGVLAIGKRWQPAFGHDWGGGRRVLDLSEVRTLAGGERGRWRRAKVPEVRASWSNLTDAALRGLWAITLAVGESEPLIFVEDADPAVGQQERIHYGTIVRSDFYERRQADKSAAQLLIRHWL